MFRLSLPLPLQFPVRASQRLEDSGGVWLDSVYTGSMIVARLSISYERISGAFAIVKWIGFCGNRGSNYIVTVTWKRGHGKYPQMRHERSEDARPRGCNGLVAMATPRSLIATECCLCLFFSIDPSSK